MANKKSMVLYDNWGSMLCMMQNEDAGALIKAIVRYAFTDRDTDFENEDIQYAFETIKDVLNVDRDKYNKQCERMEEARKQKSSKKSELKSTLKSTLKSDMKTILKSMGDTDTDTDTDIDIDNDNENDIGYPSDTKKRGGNSARFTPPTVDEVRDYCLERNNGIDAEQFVDFYASKGWMVGKNKMKDWKSCVRTWERRDRASPQKGYDMNDHLLNIINGGDIYDNTGGG